MPGFKDLAVAAMNLIEQEGCSIVVALGMPGSAPDRQAVRPRGLQGIMQAQLLTADADPRGLRPRGRVRRPRGPAPVFENRSRKHARNAYWMLFEPEQLRQRAGQGVRQGFGDAGPLGDD